MVERDLPQECFPLRTVSARISRTREGCRVWGEHGSFTLRGPDGIETLPQALLDAADGRTAVALLRAEFQTVPGALLDHVLERLSSAGALVLLDRPLPLDAAAGPLRRYLEAGASLDAARDRADHRLVVLVDGPGMAALAEAAATEVGPSFEVVCTDIGEPEQLVHGDLVLVAAETDPSALLMRGFRVVVAVLTASDLMLCQVQDDADLRMLERLRAHQLPGTPSPDRLRVFAGRAAAWLGDALLTSSPGPLGVLVLSRDSITARVAPRLPRFDGCRRVWPAVPAVSELRRRPRSVIADTSDGRDVLEDNNRILEIFESMVDGCCGPFLRAGGGSLPQVPLGRAEVLLPGWLVPQGHNVTVAAASVSTREAYYQAALQAAEHLVSGLDGLPGVAAGWSQAEALYRSLQHQAENLPQEVLRRLSGPVDDNDPRGVSEFLWQEVRAAGITCTRAEVRWFEAPTSGLVVGQAPTDRGSAIVRAGATCAEVSCLVAGSLLAGPDCRFGLSPFAPTWGEVMARVQSSGSEQVLSLPGGQPLAHLSFVIEPGQAS